MSYYISPHLLNPINYPLPVSVNGLASGLFCFYFEFLSLLLDLPAEQLHEVLETILSEEIKGALG